MNSQGVATLRERSNEVKFLVAVAIDRVLGVVIDEIVEGVEQLLSDAERAVVDHDAEVLVAIRRLQSQGVVADLQSEDKTTASITTGEYQ